VREKEWRGTEDIGNMIVQMAGTATVALRENGAVYSAVSRILFKKKKKKPEAADLTTLQLCQPSS
jgi:hypothetical protein